jgi:uncharacterized hydrophobic protein (TIGR00341 family)
MSLRQLQIIVPTNRLNKLEELLDEANCVDRWEAPLIDEHTLTGVLIQSSDVEPLTDALNDEYRLCDRFRMTLLAVEATTPKIEAEEPPKAAEEPKKTWASRLGRVSREELLEDINSGADANTMFMIMTVLSTLVACVGLTKDSAAIIIGAMVIAPLLGPNMALALGNTLGDLDLIRKSIRANLVGVAIALVMSVGFGFFMIKGELNTETAARTSVDLSDILLALASGAAGAIALSSGAAGTLVGVMVAVALLPPTATCGMLLGAGQPGLAGKAAALAMTNIACINLSAIGVFLFQGVRPGAWWETSRAKKATKRAIIIWTIVLAALAALIVFAWAE